MKERLNKGIVAGEAAVMGYAFVHFGALIVSDLARGEVKPENYLPAAATVVTYLRMQENARKLWVGAGEPR